jgi:putative endonuclease
MKSIWQRLTGWWKGGEPLPENLAHGRAGEQAAKRHLQKLGLKYLTRNFRGKRGEIDLVFRDGDCLVFVEVKARSMASWTRPAAAVNKGKRMRLTHTAFEYLRLLDAPPVKVRFDVVEVVLDGDAVDEVRHLPNAFPMSAPFRYG